MRRGTTPTLYFTTKSDEFDWTMVDILDIAFEQEETVVLEKKLEDCSIDLENPKRLSVTLSEDDTLLLNCHKNPVYIQIRIGIGNLRMASQIIITTAEKILKDGCLT